MFDLDLIPIWPISGKIFERLIFNKMFEFLIFNDVIFPIQSSFKPRNSCINFEIRRAFLDISNAFDKFLHQGLLYKLGV